MDNNTNTNTPPQPQRLTNKIVSALQWLTQSNTRVAGLFMLGLAFVLLLGLTVIITSQKTAGNKQQAGTPQAGPTTSTSQPSQIPIPSPTPDLTKDWQVIDNINGFKLKYPPKSRVLPSLNEATSSSHIQVIATDSTTLAVEVLAKDRSLLDMVNLIRDKNKDQNILTKPISILIAGYEGYEWYFKGDKFITITQTLSIKDGKNRVIQFIKDNKHFTILSTFDDTGEQLLSTIRLNQ